ncbi:hypothetical protein F3Y22_tig00111779pilonHSYRG00048 [Hibiscus syriacus]|uniref:Elongator complex protein 4 n=1 Tax=Hibiscus syriacus TaxID=106335 RepID=A0A6A2XDZ1_HIBSY|nr:hypothetical protein F3Y22_tig00111779pilonHSYRG00048 [Hibiscus syriacus]
MSGLPEGSHLLDKAKTEGGTEDDGEDEYEDDDGNRDEDGDDEEEEELIMRNRLKRRSFSLKRHNFLKVRLQGSQGKPEFKESLRSLHCLAFCFLTVATAMATAKIRRSSFSQNLSTTAPSLGPGLMCGPNGTVFLSSGIHDLDKVLGGGFPLGSLVMVMEDTEAPHHMFLLRNFMAQGLVHGQPLLYASPARDPRGFLGTLPSPVVSKDDKSREPDPNQIVNVVFKKKITGEITSGLSLCEHGVDGKREYSNEFDLQKPLERHLINEMMAAFLMLVVSLSNHFVLHSVHILTWSRICLTTIRSLKSMVQSSNSVAIITFSPSLLSPFFCKRWQHMADMLLSVKAIQDEDKKLALLLTGYQDMVGFLNVHKVARINTQVRKY